MGSGWDQDGIKMRSGWDQDGTGMGSGWEQRMQAPPLLLFPGQSASPQPCGMLRLLGRAQPCRNLQLWLGDQHSEPLQRQLPAPEHSRIAGKSMLALQPPVEERVGSSCLCKLPGEPGMELRGELGLVFPPAKSS